MDVVGVVSGKGAGESDGLVSWHAFYSSIHGWKPQYSHRVMSWEKPAQGLCKLNMDGCSLGNWGVSGWGGVLRDSSGALLFGFSIPFRVLTCIQAEIKSLHFGVQQCLLRGFSHIQAEVDSLMLVNILQGKSNCLWMVRSEVDALKAVQRLEWIVGHCFFEANQVADALSKVWAHSSSLVLYTSQSELPRLAKGTMFLDRLGTPFIRNKAVCKITFL